MFINNNHICIFVLFKKYFDWRMRNWCKSYGLVYWYICFINFTLCIRIYIYPFFVLDKMKTCEYITIQHISTIQELKSICISGKTSWLFYANRGKKKPLYNSFLRYNCFENNWKLIKKNVNDKSYRVNIPRRHRHCA